MRTYLVDLRHEHRINSSETARLMGISGTFYSKVERGTRNADMPLSMMNKIADAFGLPVETVLHMEQDYLAKRPA